jgi:hypothetical protein
MFADRDEGTCVVLGFGLLLRECWWVVEAEDDDESTPGFLRNSYLNSTGVIDQILDAIKEAVKRLPSTDADKETPKEKELDPGVEGRKAKASQKKPGKLPTRTCTPPPVASTSKKPSDTQKKDISPDRNIRSQRQRKPSKKLRDSD